MNKGAAPRTARYAVVVMLVSVLLLIAATARAADPAAAMQAYCSVPPLPGLGVRPNLLLMLDNSASMYDLAYTDPTLFCFDDTFNPAGSYPGYFNENNVYRYVTTGTRFTATTDSIAASSCNQARTDFLCVNIKAKKLDTFLATGKFLNWLAMSKLDLEKLALTGGKYDPATNLMQAESRGCVGKRYVKMVYDGKGDPLPITFGVRAPIPSEAGYVSQSSHGGPTRIDIYPAVYRKKYCLDAVKNWQENASPSELSDTAGRCMGDLVDTLGIPTPGKIFTETLSLCYSRGTDFGDAEAMVIKDDCRSRYMAYLLPFQIVRNTGEDICATKIYHNPREYNGYIHTTGYLGECTQGGGLSYNQPCALNSIKDYCRELSDPWLSDPSANANRSSTDAALPAFILDAGITSLGAPIATVVARVAADAPPAGLIQQFATEINFGAITFNDDGARSECDQEGGIHCVSRCSKDAVPQRDCATDMDCDTRGPCLPTAKSDGGSIISYINYSPVGDHATGLIAAIDTIRGTSWTPLAETLYQSIGYFANNGSYRFQPGDFDVAKPPSMYRCQRNNVLIVTDGMSTADRAPALNAFVADAVSTWSGAGGLPAGMTTSMGTKGSGVPPYQGSYNLDEVAWVARHRNIYDLNQQPAQPKDFITTHVVYTGPPCGDATSGYNADGSCTTTNEGIPEKLMQLTAQNGGGSMKSVRDLPALLGALKGIFLQVIGGSSAGAGSSLLSTGDGNGALYLQPRFFPNKSYDGGVSSAVWTGELQGLWYYIDPLIGTSGTASSIREDTDADKILDLKQDRVVRFEVPSPLGEGRATLLTDRDGDGNVDVPQPSGYPLSVVPEAVQSLWRAGRQLWKITPNKRTLYTQTDGATLIDFLDTSVDAHRQLLQAKDQAEAEQIAAFVKGVDDASGSGGTPTRERSLKAYGTAESLVWKLGDIVSSTPVVQSAVPLGSYHLPSPRGYGDSSYGDFIKGVYGKRGTVYVGANDGMLHAFRLGSLKVRPEKDWPVTRKAQLLGNDDAVVGKVLGDEEWGFIPKSALPYLRYLKEPLYPHLYYVDGSSTLVDASIGDPATCSRSDYWNCPKAGSNWRTVLLAGMGLGGASRPYGTDCVDDGSSATCVKAPAAGVGGLSSYFALDVTDQSAEGGTPRLLWEFSHPQMGFATSGAAILRVKARRVDGTVEIHDPDRNGRWFAVFASGPTGAVDRRTRQFTATSDQNLKLFVVDLNAVPPLVEGRNYWIIDTGIAYAFGGSMAGAGIDSDKWNGSANKGGQYEDEALYVGYTRRGDAGWTGGVLRLYTGEDPNPANWKTSRVIDDVGPVTGAVAKLQDRQYKRLWLYFGTGRHFYNQDDLQSARALFGVIEPCYNGSDNVLRINDICAASPVTRGDLTEVTDAGKVILPGQQPGSYRGWWIALDGASAGLASERALDSPSSVTSGAVFFPTFKPSLDPCGEGVSYLWGVQYSTGGAVGAILGQALLPLSNGSVAAVDLAAFPDRAGRRSAPLPGKAVKPRLVTNSGLKPLKRIIHMQER
ncbi:pilus assembly protein [Geomonas edaphica]|uniref:pilus assembly protein n=1 Tax=Geomonas edaphica TaxID=2570226 RepID=UPI0013A5DD7B|nr:pilus assembly protein PilY [Geomonas edaphica]